MLLESLLLRYWIRDTIRDTCGLRNASDISEGSIQIRYPSTSPSTLELSDKRARTLFPIQCASVSNNWPLFFDGQSGSQGLQLRHISMAGISAPELLQAPVIFSPSVVAEAQPATQLYPELCYRDSYLASIEQPVNRQLT